MKWHWCTNYGEDSERNVGFQADEVGNVLQRSGAVKPKACQNCQQDFNPKSVRDEVRQDMDKYDCGDCEFESNISHEALVHTLQEKEHNITIVKDSRIVGYRNTLTDAPIVRFENDDCVILCNKCNDLN